MRPTRDHVESARAQGTEYASTREALEAHRAEVRKMRNAPGEYHYTHATGRYYLKDGRIVEVRLRPAVGGGVLPGVYQYAVIHPRDNDAPRWRAVL